MRSRTSADPGRLSSASGHATGAASAMLERQIARTRQAMAAERLVRIFWPVWTIGLFAAALYLFGAIQALDAGPRLALIAVFALGIIAALGLGLRSFHRPTREEAVARLDAELPGAPLSALDDRIAIGREDPAAQVVWTRHLERMAGLAAGARARQPDLRVSDRDPWALRLAAAVALAAGLIFAKAPPELAFTDPLGTGDGAIIATGPSFEAWANPPAYTGRPTIYFGPETPDALDLPAGTEVTFRVYGAESGHELTENVSDGAAELAEIADGIRAATFVVTRSGRFALSEDGREVEARDVTVIPDAPPEIALDGEVERAVSGAMELSYTATDDYGVTAGVAEITLDLDAIDRRYGLATTPAPRDPVVLDLPMPLSGGTETVAETLIEDLSKHPWAGLPVRIDLTAEDAAGQTGRAEADGVILPGRRFFDPLARAIVEQRRDLLWSVENADRVDQMLRTITHAPEDIFTNRTAYLMTRLALRRLGYAREDGGLTPVEQEDVAEVLWQAALLIEDGSLADARERLRRAQDRLSDAIRNGATEEEIAELMQELREAMDQYMRQLAEQALRDGNQQAENQQPQSGMEITQDQLQQLLDRIQELAENGQQEQAEALLEQLRQLLENLQMQAQQGGQGGQSEGQQMMQELQDTLRQQQDLADESFQELQRQFNQGRQGQQQQGQQGQQQGQQGQQGQNQQGQQNGPGQQNQRPGGTDGLTADQLADRQEALRRMLDDLRGRLPGPSTQDGADARDRLGDAEREMGDARDRLDEGDLSGALDRQADALDALRDGIRGLGEEMQQQAEQQQGDAAQQPGEGMARDNRDPLGRPTGSRGNIRSDEQLLPGEDEMRRARELFDEIRRRAGEQSRPLEELDYLRRLLDRF